MTWLFRRLSRVALLGICLLLATSCTGLKYVTQAAAGQYDLMDRARDIDDLVREQHVDARMRRLLSSVALVKSYGEARGLKATTNYTKYVRIDRPAVVWVVSASEPLRFKSKSWSFPFVGSFTFLGWFKRPEADAFANDLRGEGWDVDVRGAGAYSTAGYFEDPVLSTMIPKSKDALGDLANTILHESAHSTFFVRNQSTLCESVANFVGDHLAQKYLEETLGKENEETRAYIRAQQEGEDRGRTMHAAYKELEALYASKIPDADKLRQKQEILTQLHDQLRFRRPITNATLIQFRTYHSGQEDLAKLLDTCGGDFPRFMRSLKRLETTPPATPQEHDIGKAIRPLIEASCPG